MASVATIHHSRMSVGKKRQNTRAVWFFVTAMPDTRIGIKHGPHYLHTEVLSSLPHKKHRAVLQIMTLAQERPMFYSIPQSFGARPQAHKRHYRMARRLGAHSKNPDPFLQDSIAMTQYL